MSLFSRYLGFVKTDPNGERILYPVIIGALGCVAGVIAGLAPDWGISETGFRFVSAIGANAVTKLQTCNDNSYLQLPGPVCFSPWE